MISVKNAPALSAAAAEAIAIELFGVTGRASALPSERDQNFRLDLDTVEGGFFVLKIANPAESRAMLEAENATMRHLKGTGLVPEPATSRNGDDIAVFDAFHVRMVSGLAGRPLGRAPRHSDDLLTDLGRAVGQIDRRLATFDHPALHRDFYWDLATAPAQIARHLPQVTDAAMRRAIESVVAVHQQHVVPHLPALRRSVIHGDVNDLNVLVDTAAGRVTGVVDFGDMVFSHTVNDAAVAMAYAALDKADPLGAAALVAAGYHAANPLSEDEIASLFGLMTMRLALSVCVAADQRAARPDVE
jgi:Ser/Thr protein kinase RdoA (MazF antagonist)